MNRDPIALPQSNEVGGAKQHSTVDEFGWPIAFFTATYGALPDFPARKAPGVLETREELAPLQSPMPRTPGDDVGKVSISPEISAQLRGFNP